MGRRRSRPGTSIGLTLPLRVPGFRASGLACGIKPEGEADLALVVSDRPATVAGVFTTSAFPSAPLLLTRRRVRRGRARAIVVNSGNANAATGRAGLRDAEIVAARVAAEAGLRPEEVLVASTGVIGRRLPVARVRRHVPELVRRAILTTDTRIKIESESPRGFNLLGFAKGSGMIQPNMATLLVFVVTDLAVEPVFLRRALREVTDSTFNRLTIDGEMSPSDTVLLLANGAAGNPPVRSTRGAGGRFVRALRSVCERLTDALAADGEGVTRVAGIQVSGARSHDDAERAARAIANSMLVKTALYGSDPNWGRIVQSLGASGARVDPARVGVRSGGVELLRRGQPVGGAAALRRATRAMRNDRVEIRVGLGLGKAAAFVLTTDLTYDYVRINAEYTT
jgi:glutamate N-acetyltransferase/amino-acid N-acetyltransferase